MSDARERAEYVPTRAEVRRVLSFADGVMSLLYYRRKGQALTQQDREDLEVAYLDCRRLHDVGLDRWHAAEIATAKVEALREAADYFDDQVGAIDLDHALRDHGTPWSAESVEAAHENSGALMDWLRARADEIERTTA